MAQPSGWDHPITKVTITSVQLIIRVKTGVRSI
jgi:hypothetical protein